MQKLLEKFIGSVVFASARVRNCNIAFGKLPDSNYNQADNRSILALELFYRLSQPKSVQAE